MSSFVDEKVADISALKEKIEYKQPSGFYLFLKRAFDIVFSILMIIILSPVFLLVALCIKIEDGGPVIHKRMCVLPDGNLFPMYKFRSMKPDADNLSKWLSQDELAEYRNEAKINNDPRITKCGKIIRKVSIDELPQLFNILFGTMSFVGPRPITKEETVHYGDLLPLLLKAKPGLTGNWQVNGRSNSTYVSGQRQELELYYAANRSIWLDIKIFFKTFKVVISKEGAK